MIKLLCEKLNVEYTTEVRHMSTKDYFVYLVSKGYDLYTIAYTYYKLLGFSDRVAVIKANDVVGGVSL